MAKHVLILGAASAIAKEAARIFASRGDPIFLCARSAERLAALCEDLRVRGCPSAGAHAMDVNAADKHDALLREADAFLSGIDVLIVAHGTLPDQKLCERDPSKAEAELRTNFVSTAAFLLRAADYFERRKAGSIAVISSVAGDRGRQSNYVYGAAKGGLNVFLEGLRNRLYHAGVHVLTVEPGFVDTPMTAHLKKNFLFASPARVAAGIVRAVDRKTDVLYTPFFWRWIMFFIRLVPEKIFKRLRL